MIVLNEALTEVACHNGDLLIGAADKIMLRYQNRLPLMKTVVLVVSVELKSGGFNFTMLDCKIDENIPYFAQDRPWMTDKGGFTTKYLQPVVYTLGDNLASLREYLTSILYY